MMKGSPARLRRATAVAGPAMLKGALGMAEVDGSSWSSRGAGWAAIWLCAAWSGAEPATAAPTFPPALDVATVRDWLRQATGATPDQVVAISPSAATRILAVEEIGPGRRRLLVEAQALNAEAAARSGVLAWRTPLEADCASGRIRLGPTMGYASRRAVGAGLPLRAADPEWRVPPAGSQLDALRQAACGAPPAPKAAPRPVLTTAATTDSKPVVKREATARDGAFAAQVISSPNAAETEQVLRHLQAQPGGALTGLQAQVAPAEVGGRTTYRGLVTGFPSREAAAAFCRALADARRPCFLRQAPAGDRPLKPIATR